MKQVLLEDAFAAARARLDEMFGAGEGPELAICSCAEFPASWVFAYQSRRYLDSGELSYALAGNGPIVVPKSGDPLYLAGSASPVEEQLGENPIARVGGLK